MNARLPELVKFNCAAHSHLADAASSATRNYLGSDRDVGFDPFAADVWELGDTLLQVKCCPHLSIPLTRLQLNRFPEDDLTALFRSMCFVAPQARPTIQYALQTLRQLLSYESLQAQNSILAW